MAKMSQLWKQKVQEVNKTYNIAGIKTPMEYSFEKASYTY